MDGYNFHSVTRQWFLECFEEPTRAQSSAWETIANGESTLLMAPTGSGKTLAAFLFALDQMMFAASDSGDPSRVLYISPIKALAVDVERNLRSPLNGLKAVAARNGMGVRDIDVAVRSGDTPQRERARMLKHPPDILITTPESLYLMLTSKASEMLSRVDTVIIDEIHALAGSKRGTHLMVSLERLEALRKNDIPLQRIGLSATQRPLDEIGRFLGGYEIAQERLVPRRVAIVDVGEKKTLDLSIRVPTRDMVGLSDIQFEEHQVGDGINSDGQAKSLWPVLYPKLLERIRAHRTTILFVNSRRTAERLANALNDVAQETVARAHHGSLAHSVRQEIEDLLKQGKLPAIVATASLELGIDMGAVDLVIQVESPPSIASGMQRIGRAQHHVGGVPVGITFPKFRADLVTCAAAHKAMLNGQIEETRYLRNPLDVLAQHIVAMVGVADFTVDAIFDLIRGAAPYSELTRPIFEAVLDMLSGRYPSDDFSELRPRLTWDRLTSTLTARKGAKRLAILNGGTIPERGLYGVFLAGDDEGRSRRVGELDEEMVFESRVGEVFLLGASSWRVEDITHDRVLVTPAPGEPGKMPFWHGDKPGRPFEFGQVVGAFLRRLDERSEKQSYDFLKTEYTLDDNACINLLAYIREQQAEAAVPTDKRIVFERFQDELGDWRICILSPFGGRVHAPWAMAVRSHLMDEHGFEIDAVWSDDGIVYRLPFGEEPPDLSVFIPSPDELEELLVRRLAESALFAARFRENAGRALLLPKKNPKGRTPLWAIRRRSASLLAVASRFSDFPIVLETYRECLKDQFDLDGAADVLKGIAERRIEVVELESDTPSPFSASLMFQYVASFMYEGDAPLAERRAQALMVDQARLHELMGAAALRELLSLDAIEQLEAQLQFRQHAPSAADDIHDLLLSLGPQTHQELSERVEQTAVLDGWLQELLVHRRIIRVHMATEKYYAASEDSARLRDALGVVIPPGLPTQFLDPVDQPLRDLVLRFARRRGPFLSERLAARYGLGQAIVDAELVRLVSEGRLQRGEFLPGGQGDEFCDADVLRRLKRMSLVKLRGEVKSVSHDAFARFTIAWHGLDRNRRGPNAILDVIDQLQGTPLPASVLEDEILARRVHDYRPSMLDDLLASGEVVWTGVRSTGPRDGRIALYTSTHLDLLVRANEPLADEIHIQIRDALQSHGALFFRQLHGFLGGFPDQLLKGLWDLIWNGEVSNDALTPLRSLMQGDKKQRQGGRRRMRLGPRRHTMLAGSEGRWWLVSQRRTQSDQVTDQQLALAQLLLERHGVLTREAAGTEHIKGGFSSVYPVLKILEESGRIRRGYFVESLGLTQFAMPGADDQLRRHRNVDEPGKTLLLATTDPANPFGAALPWPDGFTGRPERSPGSQVVVQDGDPIAFISRSGKALHTRFSDDPIERRSQAEGLVDALKAATYSHPRKIAYFEQINGGTAASAAVAKVLLDNGFERSGDALRLQLLTNEASAYARR